MRWGGLDKSFGAVQDKVDGVFTKGDGVDAFHEAIKERGGEVGVAEERGPFLIAEIRCNEGAAFASAFIDQAKELVDLVGFGIDVAELID